MKNTKPSINTLPNRLFFSSLGLFTVLFISSMALSFQQVSRQLESDIITRLGLSNADANHYIWENFRLGYISYRGGAIAKRIALGDRAGATKELCHYIKEYTQSADFRKRYEDYRQAQKPTISTQALSPMQIEMRQQQIAQMKEILAQYEEIAESLEGDYRKEFEKQLESYRQALVDLQDPESTLRQWEKNYPPSPEQMLRQRLTYLVDLLESVDYDAQLRTDDQGIKYFVRADYETQSADWKTCFRAGKEVGHTALVFAKQWLSEL